MDSLFTQQFRWFPYDKQANSDSGTRLKPDLMGAILEDPAVLSTTIKGPTISWDHAVSVVEIKGDWQQLIAQTATYTRQIVAHQPHRVAVPCVMINHISRAAAIAEFDRAGGYATRWHDLKTPGGIA